MPRVKKSVATKRASETMSDDAQVALADAVGPADAAATLTVEAQSADPAQAVVAGEAGDAVKSQKKVGPKAARRAKTCEKCLQRREREREYARIARSKSRSLKEAKKDAAGAVATPPEDVPTVPAEL